MILAQAKLGIRVELTENRTTVFVVENPKMWQENSKVFYEAGFGRRTRLDIVT